MQTLAEIRTEILRLKWHVAAWRFQRALRRHAQMGLLFRQDIELITLMRDRATQRQRPAFNRRTGE